MKMSIVLVVFLILATSCKRNNSADEVTLNKNGDTVEVIKRYASKKIKEIVTYRNNKPVNNIGFYETGDTIKEPDVIFTPADSMLFAYLPRDKNIVSANIYLGMDSIKWEQPYYLRIHDSICEKLTNLNRSVTFRLRSELLTDGEFVGVFDCKIGSTGASTFFPFKTKIKSGEQGPDTVRHLLQEQPSAGVSVTRE